MSEDWPMCPPTVPVDFLSRIVQMHPVAVPALELVAKRLAQTEYGEFIEARHRSGAAVSGGFNCRPRSSFMRPDGTFPPITMENHSEHAHGAACDFNFGPPNPARTDGFLTCDYARFGREDGEAVMRAWLEPPPGLPHLFRWGGIDTTDFQAAAAVLPEPPTFTRHVGGTFADAHHFDLLALTLDQVEGFDWTEALETDLLRAGTVEEDDEMGLTEEAQATIINAHVAATAAKGAADGAKVAAEGLMAGLLEVKAEVQAVAEEARRARHWQAGFQAGLVRPEEAEPEDPDRAGGFRTARALRKLVEPEV